MLSFHTEAAPHGSPSMLQAAGLFEEATEALCTSQGHVACYRLTISAQRASIAAAVAALLTPLTLMRWLLQAGFPVRKEAQPFVPQQEQQPALSHSPGSEWLRQAMAEQLSRQGSSKPAAAVEAAAGSSKTAELAALAASDRKAEACSTADVATLTAMLEAHAVKDAQTQRKLDQIQSAPACATQPTSDVHGAAACAERQQTEPVDGLPQLLHSSLPLMQSSSGQLLALQQELEHVPATFQDRRPPAPSQAPSDQQPTDVQLSSANNSVPAGSQSTNKSIEPPKDSNSPVFVPIVLAMEESDHRVLIQEWHARQLVSAAVLVCTMSAPRCRRGMLVYVQGCASSAACCKAPGCLSVCRTDAPAQTTQNLCTNASTVCRTGCADMLSGMCQLSMSALQVFPLSLISCMITF